MFKSLAPKCQISSRLKVFSVISAAISPSILPWFLNIIPGPLIPKLIVPTGLMFQIFSCSKPMLLFHKLIEKSTAGFGEWMRIDFLAHNVKHVCPRESWLRTTLKQSAKYFPASLIKLYCIAVPLFTNSISSWDEGLVYIKLPLLLLFLKLIEKQCNDSSAWLVLCFRIRVKCFALNVKYVLPLKLSAKYSPSLNRLLLLLFLKLIDKIWKSFAWLVLCFIIWVKCFALNIKKRELFEKHIKTKRRIFSNKL